MPCRRRPGLGLTRSSGGRHVASFGGGRAATPKVTGGQDQTAPRTEPRVPTTRTSWQIRNGWRTTGGCRSRAAEQSGGRSGAVARREWPQTALAGCSRKSKHLDVGEVSRQRGEYARGRASDGPGCWGAQASGHRLTVLPIASTTSGLGRGGHRDRRRPSDPVAMGLWGIGMLTRGDRGGPPEIDTALGKRTLRRRRGPFGWGERIRLNDRKGKTTPSCSPPRTVPHQPRARQPRELIDRPEGLVVSSVGGRRSWRSPVLKELT